MFLDRLKTNKSCLIVGENEMPQLEEEKEKQIQVMRLQLYESLNAALREKEMVAMRLKLQSLEQKMQEQLALQASTKAREARDSRIRSKESVNEKKRVQLEEKNKKQEQRLEEKNKKKEQRLEEKNKKKEQARPRLPKLRSVTPKKGVSRRNANGAVEPKKKPARGAVKTQPKKKK